MSYALTPAEVAFREAGPIYHLYTKPLEADTLYQSEQERVTAMNLLSISIVESPCKLLAYSLMSNHFHFIIEGTTDQVLAFFASFMKRLKTYYRYHGREIDLSGMEPGLTFIETVRHFQTELAYVIRNAFVVQPNVNVFADRWSSGYLYFNLWLAKEGVPGNKLKVREIRAFSRSRTASTVPDSIYVKDGMAQPWSFVNYTRAMSFYDNARQFVYSVLKNVEAQVQTSLRYGEIPQLPDEELIPIIYKFCKESMNLRPSELDLKGRQKLAMMLKNEYYASNGQIARLAKMPLAQVNELFPMVAKAQIK